MDPGAVADIALWGGGPSGETLALVSLNEAIVQAYDVTYVTAKPLGDNLRRIQLTANNIGQTVIEARLGMSGPAWASVGIGVGITPSATPSGRSDALDDAITGLESTAVNFAQRFIRDARVRENYVAQAKQVSQEILDEVNSGKISPEAAAQKAADMRNGLLDASRLNNSDLGQAISEAEKATGKSIEELMGKYAGEQFGQEFGQLGAAEQDFVFIEIVKAAGRPSPRFTKLAAIGGKAGKGLIVVSLAFAVYNVAASDRPGREAAKQGAGLGAGFLGSLAGGAAAGLVCGPGAPICVGVGVLVGGIAFAVGADLTFDWLWH
jgi:hypothetical protein